MKTYKEKTVKVLDQIMCDACGKNCTGWDDARAAIREGLK